MAVDKTDNDAHAAHLGTPIGSLSITSLVKHTSTHN